MSLSPRGGGDGVRREGRGWRTEAVGMNTERERDGWRIVRRRQTWAMQGWLRLSGTSDGGRCITSDVSIPADAGLSLRHTHTRTLARTHASELIEASGFGPTPGTGGNDCHPFFPPSAPRLNQRTHKATRVHTDTYTHVLFSPLLSEMSGWRVGGGCVWGSSGEQ